MCNESKWAVKLGRKEKRKQRNSSVSLHGNDRCGTEW